MRITPCEAGAILHRPGTRLIEARRRCTRGHLAPLYADGPGDCVACGKIRGVENYLRRTAALPRRLAARNRTQFFADYAAAAACHEDTGGWLLCLPGGYGVTCNLNTLYRLRGGPWMRRCEALQCWDETELPRQARPERDSRGRKSAAEARL